MKVDAMIYTFTHFECDTRDATLSRDGLALEIEPDVFRLLAYLLEHRDRVVSKVELLDNLWPDETVSLAGIPRYVRAARHMVGDDGYRQEVIETVRGEGYRFIAHVEEQMAIEIAASPRQTSRRQQRTRSLPSRLADASRFRGNIIKPDWAFLPTRARYCGSGIRIFP